VGVRMRACVRVCVGRRGRARESVRVLCVRVRACARTCACGWACVVAYVWVCGVGAKRAGELATVSTTSSLI
jgi:hypothetical protein